MMGHQPPGNIIDGFDGVFERMGWQPQPREQVKNLPVDRETAGSKI
jgi:hypothetical protein